MPAIQGLRGTGEFSVDFRPKNYRELFTLLEPNGTAPLQALLAMAGSEETNDPEYKKVAKGMCIADAETSFTKAMDAKKLQPTTVENGAPITYYSLQDWNAADKERKDAKQSCEEKYGK